MSDSWCKSLQKVIFQHSICLFRRFQNVNQLKDWTNAMLIELHSVKMKFVTTILDALLKLKQFNFTENDSSKKYHLQCPMKWMNKTFSLHINATVYSCRSWDNSITEMVTSQHQSSVFALW